MYSNEKNAQIIVALLKQHGIRRVIASPGNTNFGIVGSMQQDSFFEIYSSIDERSAAYMACGMAASSAEPVVLSCTGATASRDYLPGLTEAYYRKLPIIAITSFNGTQNVGQLMPQNLDRMHHQRDVSTYSVDVPIVKDAEDERFVNRVVNEAILGTWRHGGGPVHINVSCHYKEGQFETPELPKQRIISRHTIFGEFPSMESYNKIAIFMGAHLPLTEREDNAITAFAKSHNVAVMCDHTSNYTGPRSLLAAMAAENTGRWKPGYSDYRPDLIIDLGEISGDYVTEGFLKSSRAETWRISDDGELRDRFGGLLTRVFEMPLTVFFEHYTRKEEALDTYFQLWAKRDAELRAMVPELPFTNRWMAIRLASSLPNGSVLHMAILNSLRSWNYAPIDPSIRCFCNTGGFGIDGCMSAAIGSALTDLSRLTFLVIGDLAFFYDMNSLGNRELPSNLRILLVNNGTGAEFHMPYSPAYVMGADVDYFVAAEGHFGARVRGIEDGLTAAECWCAACGVEHRRALNKNQFSEAISWFVESQGGSRVLECITFVDDEESAAEIMRSLDPTNSSRRRMAGAAKGVIKGIIGDKGVAAIKNRLG